MRIYIFGEYDKNTLAEFDAYDWRDWIIMVGKREDNMHHDSKLILAIIKKIRARMHEKAL